uniref:AAA ATPase domain-containing protein n=1 Tax=Candidatus Kentrum sp. LFY TaxID=2126342 RepID=A0A450V378_9GAMM|nr:MAG: AAA ATPase domain-containing protein [Candidatus Kentron sp. LFY]
MRTIDISTLHSLVDVVSPLVRTEPERRAFVNSALEGNRELSKKIQWTGTGELFLLKFFQLLMEDANERDSTNTITAFLHAARDRLGSEHHRRIDEAVRSVEDSLTFEREPSDPGPPLPLKIFLASPGDVSHERQLAREVIGYIPYDPLLRERIDLKEIAWDTPGAQTPLFAATSPQTSVIRNLSPPSECDLVVVILWSRIGTPLNRHYHRTDNGGRYNSGTEWEYLDALNANRKQGTPDILVYRRTENPRIDVNDPKVHDAISQWQSVEEFFSGFNDADGSALGGYNPYKTPDEFRRQFESHLKAFIRQRLDARTQRPSVSVEAGGSPLEYWEGSPFPGLRAFTPDDAPIFFGRGRETDELLERLSHKQNRFIAVVGASGSGKSSLVAAGLIPRLLAGAMEGRMDWRWIRFTPGAQPFVAFANAIAPSSRQGTSSRHGLPGPSARDGNKQPGSREPASRDGFDEPSARDGKGMDDYDPGLAEALSLLESALHGSPSSTEWLVYIDQFEEFLTLTRPSLQGEFVEWLARLTTMPRVHVIVTLRADFYAGCVAWESLSKLLRTGSFPLSAPNMVALHEIITRPADRARLHFESGLPVKILEDTGSDPGSLALMAFALAELHAGRDDGGELTFESYDAFEGVQGVIGKRAEETMAALAPAVQDALSHVFRELVEVDDRGVVTRQRAPKPKVVLSPESDVLVTALTDARLLVSNVDSAGDSIIEVAHEALLRSWPRLAEWIDSCMEDLRQLRQVRIAVEEWVRRGKAEAFHWPEERRHLQAGMLHRLRPPVSEEEWQFLGDGLRKLEEMYQAVHQWISNGYKNGDLWPDEQQEELRKLVELVSVDLDEPEQRFINPDLRLLREIRLSALEWERQGLPEDGLWTEEKQTKARQVAKACSHPLNEIEALFVNGERILLRALRLESKNWVERGYRPEELWSGEKQAHVQEIAKKYGYELNEQEKHFITFDDTTLLRALSLESRNWVQRGYRKEELWSEKKQASAREVAEKHGYELNEEERLFITATNHKIQKNILLYKLAKPTPSAWKRFGLGLGVFLLDLIVTGMVTSIFDLDTSEPWWENIFAFFVIVPIPMYAIYLMISGIISGIKTAITYLRTQGRLEVGRRKSTVEQNRTTNVSDRHVEHE